NYYISGSYFNQQGIIKSSGYHKYHFRANVDIKLSKYVKTGVRLNVSRNYQRASKVDFHHLLQQVLTSRSVYNKDGLFTGVNPVSASVRANPIAKIKLMNNHNYVTNILGNAYLQVNPIEGLTLK